MSSAASRWIRVSGAVRSVFRKFREHGSARQVLLWARAAEIRMPVTQPGPRGTRLEWREPAYHNVLLMLSHPIYAGAYVFGRTEVRTHILAGRARKTSGHKKPRERWSVLIRDHHPGYIAWAEFEHNQVMLRENAHMQKRASRKSGRGGRALLTGLMRCGRCGRMLHVYYGMASQRVHRYQCRGDEMRSGSRCLGIGGVRVDRAVSTAVVEAVAPRAVEAALEASARAERLNDDARRALVLELEEARYEAQMAARRHAAVDPDKRLVARELESRWEAELARVRQLEERLVAHDAQTASQPQVERETLLALAGDLASVWNAPTSDMRIKQRIVRTLVREIVVDQDPRRSEVVLAIHWAGGRHTEIRVARIRSRRYPSNRHPGAVEVMRKLGGQCPDCDLAITMNRMRCKSDTGATWTIARVRELRERLEIAAFDPAAERAATISADEAARRLGVCIGSIQKLIREGVLPASQAMPSAPWQVPVDALATEAVQIGVRAIVARRPRNFKTLQDDRTLRLPGM
jgi:hypothetical protein